MQSLSSPIGGIAGHYFNRVAVLCAGAMIWGTFCAAFAYSTTVYQVGAQRSVPITRREISNVNCSPLSSSCHAECVYFFGSLQGMVFWSFNGLGLALLVPNAQSLIADYYPAHQRGEAFGMLYLTGI